MKVKFLSCLCCTVLAGLLLSTSQSYNVRAASVGLVNRQVFSASLSNDLSSDGRIYNYNINGKTLKSIVPPKGFNPVTASDDQLKQYGFNPRPKNSKDLEQWNQVMSHYQRTVVPTLTETTMRSNDFALGNWSGYENYDGTNGYTNNPNTINGDLNDVNGDFIQPSAYNASDNSSEASWVGLGGDDIDFGPGSSSLVQTGTAIDVDSNGNASYFGWLEWLSPNWSVNMIKNGISVNPGDAIHLEVSFDPNTYDATFIMLDENTGEMSDLVGEFNISFYNGSTAEWIDEAPTVNGQVAHLANFNSNTWVNCKSSGTSTGWANMGNRNYDRLLMENNYAFCYPDVPSDSTTFTDRVRQDAS